MAERKPAIDRDDAENKTLDQITASDFLKLLGTGEAVGLQALQVWPEKKKYELLVEPENFGRLRVVDLVRGIREKKKVELEKPPRIEGWEIPKRAGPEDWWRDPRQVLRDPDFLRDLAQEVAIQLRQMR